MHKVNPTSLQLAAQFVGDLVALRHKLMGHVCTFEHATHFIEERGPVVQRINQSVGQTRSAGFAFGSVGHPQTGRTNFGAQDKVTV